MTRLFLLPPPKKKEEEEKSKTKLNEETRVAEKLDALPLLHDVNIISRMKFYISSNVVLD